MPILRTYRKFPAAWSEVKVAPPLFKQGGPPCMAPVELAVDDVAVVPGTSWSASAGLALPRGSNATRARCLFYPYSK